MASQKLNSATDVATLTETFRQARSSSKDLHQLASALPCARSVSTSEQADIEALPEWQTEHIVNEHRLNDVRYLNKFLEAVNEKLPIGGCFVGCAETSQQRKRRILNKYRIWLARPYYVLDFVGKRVLPKSWLTKRMYFAVTKGRNRVLPQAEILGRLVSCGFDIIEHLEVENKLYFMVRKVRSPAYDLRPSYGLIFKMKRVGQGGRTIGVYKFRTMHAYAEYLQSHVHENNKLAKNGKLNDDFRVTTWGRVMRRLWIDELPMLINWFKGEVKLVGVRPLSEHYLSLYPQRVAEHRLRHKPGLVPPYYADLPQSFDEIVESEEKYLQAYEQHPRGTDIRYFFKACYNILIKRSRSQ